MTRYRGIIFYKFDGWGSQGKKVQILSDNFENNIEWLLVYIYRNIFLGLSVLSKLITNLLHCCPTKINERN